MAKTRKRKAHFYSTNVYSPTHFRAIRKVCDAIPEEAMAVDWEPTTKNRLTYLFKKTDPLVHRIYTKDLVQAGMLLAVLRERRGAELQALWQNLLGRGPGWRERAEQGALALQRQYPGLGIQGLLQV